MIVIDTNLAIRYLTNDDLEQSRHAREIINAEPVFAPITVVLEIK